MSTMSRTPVDGLTAAQLGLPLPLLNRQSLENAQLRRLQQTITQAIASSHFYRQLYGRNRIVARGMTDRAALSRLPLVTADGLRQSFSQLLCVSQQQVARIVTLHTSGSTSSAKRVAFSAADLAATRQFFYHGMLSLVTQEDRVLVLLPNAAPDSVGDLLLRALHDGGITAAGCWPPADTNETMAAIDHLPATCLVGLPQHLLAIAERRGPGRLRSMLLCSDYAAPALRRRIEAACGCQTFLHYGSTESGLGGGVECACHNGCHLRAADLLVEIIDPDSGQVLPDGQPGEIVITTLGREAMPLIRYRTGDLGSLDRTVCPCGGISPRLLDIGGRLARCRLADGGRIGSQELDDQLFAIPGLLDYRAYLDRQGKDRLHLQFVFRAEGDGIRELIQSAVAKIPAIADNLTGGGLVWGACQQVKEFAVSHTVKRTLQDTRGEDIHAAYA